jgi:hypothetical protein
MPIRLSDPQLRQVMETAAQLELEKRDAFLQRLAAGLRLRGIREPTDVDLERAAQAALRGRLPTPAA